MAAIAVAMVLQVLVIAVGPAPVGASADDGVITWAQRLGGPTTGTGLTPPQEIYRSVDTDSASNVIGVGTFNNTASISGTDQTLVASGPSDLMVVKYDSAGALRWAKRFGGISVDAAYGVNVDQDDNIVICGAFRRTITFGATSLTSTLTNVSDPFVAKLDGNGNPLWAAKAGAYQGTGGPTQKLIVASECGNDAQGNVYVSGSFNVPGRWETTPVTLITPTSQDGFVAKFDPNGAIQWVRRSVGGTAPTSFRTLGVTDDGTGDLLLGGTMEGTVTFGSTPALVSNGGKDGFVSRLDTDGNWRWSKNWGGATDDEIRGVATSGSDVVWGGKFTGTADVLGAPLTTLGGTDTVVFKTNADGERIWASAAGSTGEDEGMEVDVDPVGNVIAGGTYNGTLTFGATTATSGDADFLLALFDPAGTPVWASTPSGSPAGACFADLGCNDYVYDAKADALGGYVFGGFFQATAEFGTTTLTSAGIDDAVIGRIAPAEPPEPVAPSNTSPPAITGTPQAGSLLTASNGAWAGAPTGFEYQWRRCDASGLGCVDIDGATTATYVAQAADVGSTLRVAVTASNATGSTAASSEATGTVTAAPQPEPQNTAAPELTGTAVEGETIGATTGSWTGAPTTFGYRWRRCDPGGGSCVDVAGQTASSYLLTGLDVGRTIEAVVTATNATGTGSATSGRTDVVAAQPLAPCAGQSGDPVPYDVVVPRAAGGTMPARMWAPSSGPCPAVVVMPGACSTFSTVAWSGAGLAKAGYVVIAPSVSAGNDTARCNAGATDALDFIESDANPYRSRTDLARIGAAGWSLGGRTLVLTQEQHAGRVDAIVVWDNLASSESGDAGSPACTNVPDPLRTPKVPAMGQASSESCPAAPYEAKKIGFEHWKAAGQPTMQLVFDDSNHFWWGNPGTAQQHALELHYTVAWLDRYVKGDTGATARLLAPAVDGVARSSFLSDEYASAVAFDGYDCPDYRRGCVPVAEAGPTQFRHSGSDFPLDATGSASRDGDPLSYHWVQLSGPPVVIRDERSAVTMVDGITGPAELLFQVTVTNPNGLTTTDTVPVYVVRPK